MGTVISKDVDKLTKLTTSSRLTTKTVDVVKRVFAEPSGLYSVNATDVSRKLTQVLDELSETRAVEVKRKGARAAVMIEPLLYEDMITTIESQNDYIEQLEDLAAIRRNENIPAKERGFTPLSEAFTKEDSEDNEFRAMNIEELFGR